MPEMFQNATPALGLLLLLVLLAWGARKFRRHLVPGGAQATQSLRLLSSLALGPQQRVVLVEMTDPASGQRHLITVGLTPHAITALHSTPQGLSAGFQAELASQLRAPPTAPAPAPSPAP